MSKRTRLYRCLFQTLASLIVTPTAYAAMPAASLPLEPATSDEELFQEKAADTEAAAPAHARVSKARLSSEAGGRSVPLAITNSPSRNTDASELGNFAAQLRLGLVQEGFGGELKFIQYPQAWIGTTEKFRYGRNEEEARLYLLRRGLLVGADFHPWRSAFISPFFNLAFGWESFARPEGLSTVQTAVGETQVGLELRLTKFASIVGQWTEAYYPSMKERVFFPDDLSRDKKRYAAAEVMFNLQWEKSWF